MFYKYVQDLITRGDELNTIAASYNGSDARRLSSGFPASYNGLEVKVGFGKGQWTLIPWIGFLAPGQKITQGIYPVLLYYRKNNLLILAYGISASKTPSILWSTKGLTTIRDYFKTRKIVAHKAYDKSFVYEVYPADRIPKTIEHDIDHLISYYKSFIAKAPVLSSPSSSVPTSAPGPVKPVISKKMVSSIISAIKSSGLIYSDQFISRFAISLMTKPFVILSGLAGSGKTQLAIAFAKAICADFKKQVRIVPVGADWTNREPLLGYPNALNEGKYVQPDSDVLQLILNAAIDPEQPYFLILDEMNLSYVERYFADFLSALESKEAIPLWKNDSSTHDAVPEAISLPNNLYIIGTINVDETTYMFSPKVLDRANVLEFKIDYKDLDNFLDDAPDVDLSRINGSLATYAKSFVEYSQKKVPSGYSASKDTILAFFKELKAVNAEFGYRSAAEIGRFIALAIDLGDMEENDAVDSAIVQKLLPKLHGSRKKLVPVLTALWVICETGVDIELANDVPEETKYPLTADKLLRMYRGAIDNGFTSFAEA